MSVPGPKPKRGRPVGKTGKALERVSVRVSPDHASRFRGLPKAGKRAAVESAIDLAVQTTGGLWCAFCGTWGDHRSGTCPELVQQKQPTGKNPET